MYPVHFIESCKTNCITLHLIFSYILHRFKFRFNLQTTQLGHLEATAQDARRSNRAVEPTAGSPVDVKMRPSFDIIEQGAVKTSLQNKEKNVHCQLGYMLSLTISTSRILGAVFITFLSPSTETRRAVPGKHHSLYI